MLPILPSPSLELVVLTVLALGMVGFNLWVVLQFFPRKGGVPILSRAMFVALILITSGTLWLSLLYDVQTGNNDDGFVAILFGINIMMCAPMVWAATLILRANERHIDGEDLIWPGLLALIVVGNEVLMGAVYDSWLYGYSTVFPSGPWGSEVALSDAVASIWFALAMVANMAILLYWLPIPPARRNVLLGLTATGLATPWVASGSLAGAVAMALVMGSTLLLAFRGLRSPDGRTPSYVRTVIGVFLGFSAMTAGAIVSLEAAPAVWAATPLALAVASTMGLEFFFVARSALLAHPADDGAPVPEAHAESSVSGDTAPETA